ncbi:hypothetical protein BN873_360007 [Candidatus Competibacter denitrificans Run_A_D11]|uniref:Uncharacterized protein n=1 Tax=Candidatus Competibacter denitrificans Run_A_D11 TaxID=1400863 RepID=W6MDI3_9GAMM|nr:hypothetical protein BN873_360007 [Candidatus Competibacter denitrificans Run_A_D11]
MSLCQCTATVTPNFLLGNLLLQTYESQKAISNLQKYIDELTEKTYLCSIINTVNDNKPESMSKKLPMETAQFNSNLLYRQEVFLDFYV